jgi:hydrogenase nickel incorporation protein HypA/HybF
MHELSLAKDILDTVKQSLPPEDLPKIRSIILEVGAYSGVISDSLKFSFEAIISGTEMSEARLEIIDVPFVLHCNNCTIESVMEFPMLICDSCGSMDVKVISGDELKIMELKILDS